MTYANRATATNDPNHNVAGADTGPIPAASTSAIYNLSAMASIPKCSRARACSRPAKAVRSDGDRPAISTRAAAQPCASGARSHPVRSPGVSTTLSVGPSTSGSCQSKRCPPGSPYSRATAAVRWRIEQRECRWCRKKNGSLGNGEIQ
jgi:hypothetical protein